MSISASMVKELRDHTGAGMMECKKALVETGGDMERAVEILRKLGQAKADKKSGRIAADGCIILVTEGNRGVIAEINSETDFAAKDQNFIAFANHPKVFVGFVHLAHDALFKGSLSHDGPLILVF